MAYTLPGVEIVQDYENPGSIPVQGQRPHIVVGALEQCVTKKAFTEFTIKLGDTIQSNVNIDAAQLGLKVGGVIKTITGGFLNATVQILTEALSAPSEATTPKFVQGAYSIEVSASVPLATVYRIVPGSLVEHKGILYTVRERVGRVLNLNRAIVFSSVQNDSYKVYIQYSSIESSALVENGVASVSTNLGSAGTLAAGVPYISFTASRCDLSGVLTYYRPSDVEAVMETNEGNPLGFGLMMAFAGNGGAVPVKALPLNPNLSELEAYAEAFTVLRARKDVYYVSVCTDNASVHTMLAQHIAAMNDPKVGYWRSAFVNSVIALESKVGSITTTV